MGFDLQQAEFEYLEQADRAGADDQGIGFVETTGWGADDIHNDSHSIQISEHRVRRGVAR